MPRKTGGQENIKVTHILGKRGGEVDKKYINSHIKYLEKEIERLETDLKIVNLNITNNNLPLSQKLSNKYKQKGWAEMIEEEISHKQQELLQAKELLDNK